MAKQKPLQYEVNNVPIGIRYHYEQLLELKMNRYTYKNLPSTIPADTLERFLNECGTCRIFDKGGKLWVLPVQEYGVGVYWSNPPEYITANPVLRGLQGKTDSLTDNSAMMYNNKLHTSSRDQLKRYATQLAQVESTIDISLVNMRALSIAVGNDDKQKRDWELFYKKLQTGELTAIVSDTLIAQLDSLKLFPTSNQMQSNGLRDLYNLRNNIYRQFLRECGIRTTTEKTQFVSGDEIVNDDLLLTYYLDKDIEVRRECLEKVNNLYGTSIEIEYNEALQPIVEAPTTNESVATSQRESEGNNGTDNV